MHYLPKLLNTHGYFQRLNTLLHKEGMNESSKTMIEHFLHRATSVLVSLGLMYNAEKTTVELVRSYIKQIKFGEDKKIAISTESIFEAYNQIPIALSQLVAMQNQLLPIIQKAFEIKSSIPSSLNKAMKAGLEKYEISKDIVSSINDYWKNGGEYLRNVRDINEHFIALVDYTYFKYEKDPGQILILFPDNPEVKSPKNFLYDTEIDAYAVISQGLQSISNLIDTILKINGLQPSNFANTITLGHMGNLEKEQERTLGVMIDITKIEKNDHGYRLSLDALELQQIIPDREMKGNLAVRKLKPDHEVFP